VLESKLKDLSVTVIGVGAIGRNLAIQLAAIGVQKLKIVDFDIVAVENLAPQGFREIDLNKTKVEAVEDICKAINSEISIESKNMKFNNSMCQGGVVFVCVDSINVRKEIFNGICNKCDLFIDGRMSAEYMRILSVSDLESKEYYEKQFFTQEEAYSGSCTAKSTIYAASTAASIMVAQLARWTREIPIEKEICVNLLSMEMRAL
jgi:sulfur carrier protein ThiS adenylyltransferase